MGKIFAIPAPRVIPAAPVFASLWDVHQCIETITKERPRDATQAEVRSYLLTLAQRRGVYVPDNATIGDAGIYVEGTGYIVEMPGYGADTTVTMEQLDESGAVVRTSRIGTEKGKLRIDAAAVREVCALPKPVKARKPRAVKAAPVAEVTAQPDPIIAPVCQPEPVQTPIVDASVGDLVARLAALEAVVARLSRPVVAGKRVRTEAERRAVLRAWQMRREMRERADLDRRALMAANEANRMLLEKLAQAEHSRDIARTGAAANLRTTEAAERRAAAAVEAMTMHAEALRDSQARALRMVGAAKRHRTAAQRAAIDLRASQAEARALTRRLAAAPMRERATPDMMTLHARVADRVDA